MWAFFSKRLRMWLVLAVAVPVVGWVLGKVADLVESRRGPSGFTRTLRSGSGWLNNRARGPLAARHAADPTGARDAGAPAR